MSIFSVQTTLKIHKHWSFQGIFETSQENWTSSPIVAMFRFMKWNRANLIFVRIQLIATEGGMSLFPDNRLDNLL